MDPQTASLEMMEKFWTDWFTTIGKMQTQAASAAMRSAGAARDGGDDGSSAAAAEVTPGAPFPTPEALRQLQSSFLDTFARYCDEYMRSPQFLALMKQTMDNALSFRQQVNEFLEGAVAAGFQPPIGLPPDQAVIVDAVRETERKLRDHIEALSDRLGRLEARLDGVVPAAKPPGGQSVAAE